MGDDQIDILTSEAAATSIILPPDFDEMFREVQLTLETLQHMSNNRSRAAGENTRHRSVFAVNSCAMPRPLDRLSSVASKSRSAKLKLSCKHG